MKVSILSALILFISYVIHAQVPAGIPTKGLQGFWSFSGNANDMSGNLHHGKPRGVTLMKDRFGNDQSAYYFNGFSTFITTSYEGILDTHPRTVSFWAIVYDSQKGEVAVTWGNNEQFPNAGGRFDCSFGGCFVCDSGEHFVGPTIDVSDAGVTFEGQESVTDGKWHHYIYRFDKKYVRDVEIYQDGLLLTHEQYHFYKNCAINTKPEVTVTFGTLFRREDTCSYFMGMLDDIAIYDRALSREEINALYTAPDPNKKTDILKWVPVFLAVLLTVLLIVWFIRFRVKKLIKKEKEKFQLERKWYAQENRVLKAQMDPHFIFNSLNSIQQFIIVNENEKAQLYLSTFSQLIRMQLESNTSESITLAEEINILEKYLEIESLRFNNAFDYEIIVEDNIHTKQVNIPCFLIQPFVENAIHHGLLPKIGYKELDIHISRHDEKTLLCLIDDNGIGRKNPDTRQSVYKKKSLGVNFVQQRLLIMSKIENYPYGVEIMDKEDKEGRAKGIRVIIKMPILK